jgi:hypothetical protein
VTLAGYYAVRHGMKFQLVTPYRFTHLQRYEVTLRGNVTSVYPPLKSHAPVALCVLRRSKENVQNIAVKQSTWM